MFNAFRDAITAPDGAFLANSLALGNEIFVTIFVTMVVYGLCKCALAQDFTTFWWDLGALVFKMIGPLAALNFAHLILPQIATIADFFTGQITGYGAGADGTQALIDLGHAAALALIQNATNPLSVFGTLANAANIPVTVANIVMAWVAACVVTFAFVWVAAELVLAWYQVLLASSIGAASVGFFGSDATADMAFRYTSGVIAGIWKVVFLTVWPYTVMAVFTRMTFMADLANPQTFLQTVINVLAFALVVLVATFRVARMADHMFSGQAAFTAADIGRVARSAAARTAGAVRNIGRVA